MILYLAAEIYALRIKTQDNILNSIQSTKNVGNKLQVETLSDGVMAQEFAIQYVSVSHCHTRAWLGLTLTRVSLTCVMWSDNSENENVALQT